MPWKRSLNSLAMLMLMSSSIANAQSADSFKTAEYNEMGYNVLDAVNAASAYANGYTGKGVIVGVCDDPINFLVPEFDLKQNSEMINVAGAGVYNWANFTHGTHVAGVVAASKNGLGMHGIAFDAEIKGSTAGRIYYSDGSFESRKDLYAYYVQHPEIKVINNSWGTGCYLTNIDDNQAYELLQSGVLTPTGNPEWQDYLYNNTIQFREAVAHDKLLVWAAGNNGHTMASIENTSPVFDRSLSNNFITVTAGDAAALHRNKTGGFDASFSYGPWHIRHLALEMSCSAAAAFPGTAENMRPRNAETIKAHIRSFFMLIFPFHEVRCRARGLHPLKSFA